MKDHVYVKSEAVPDMVCIDRHSG